MDLNLNIDRQEKNKQEYENEKTFDDDKNKAKESLNNLSDSTTTSIGGDKDEGYTAPYNPTPQNNVGNNTTSTSSTVENDQTYDQSTNGLKKPNVQPQETIYNEDDP